MERLTAQCVIDFVLPVTFYPRKNVFFGDFFNLARGVALWVVLEDDSDNLILRSA